MDARPLASWIYAHTPLRRAAGRAGFTDRWQGGGQRMVRALFSHAELSLLIQQRRTELQAIAEKVSEIESDADEHRYVQAFSAVNS